MDLEGRDMSYIIASSDNINQLVSYLYAKDYTIVEISGYYNDKFENSIICWGQSNEDIIRDSRMIINEFNQESVIFKLSGDTNAKKMSNDKTKDLGVVMYNTDSKNRSYIHNGISFSFVEKMDYKFPKTKSDLKNGMVVECYSNSGDWIKRTIRDLDSEYPKVYDTLSKYNRVRIPSY